MQRSLSQWLEYQESIHPRNIEFGLDRIGRVWQRLQPVHHPRSVLVAGTNGKGSCVAYMESMMLAGDVSVAAYTSPHLRHYRERLRINGQHLSDDDWCAAFARVEAARQQESLTYFEFGTLAALSLAADAGVEVQLLEVGLGGRLDAVNIIDAEVAVIASIGTDHQQWLGAGREAIAREKAGIMRSGALAICGDIDPPSSLFDEAARIGARLELIGDSFGYARTVSGSWHWSDRAGTELSGLPALSVQSEAQYRNASCAIRAVQALDVLAGRSLAAVEISIGAALAATRLPGRMQIMPGPVPVILDVAHNVEACLELNAMLVDWQRKQANPVRMHAVFSALSDKPVKAMCAVLASAIHAWYVATLDETERGAQAEALLAALPEGSLAQGYGSVRDAWKAARENAMVGDAILVFGSFHTVAAVVEETHD